LRTPDATESISTKPQSRSIGVVLGSRSCIRFCCVHSIHRDSINMRSTLRLLMAVSQGALILTTTCFLLTFISFKTLLPPSSRLAPPPREPSPAQALILVLFFVVPAGLGGWWVFRKLSRQYPRREARAAALAFGVTSPVPLIAGMVLGEVVGVSAERLLGSPVALPAVFVAIVLIIALMTFIPSAFTLWIMNRTKSIEHQEKS